MFTCKTDFSGLEEKRNEEKEWSEDMLKLSTRGQIIHFEYIDGFREEWVALSNDGFFEGDSPEDVVGQTKKAIDEKKIGRNE